MSSAFITALATALLVAVGLAQVGILVAQRRQHRLELVETYRRRWEECWQSWATVVFIGRDIDEYYQIADEETLKELEAAEEEVNLEEPTVWARDSVREVSELMSDICLRVLMGN